MARYIKANRKVAEYLRLENDRYRTKDGNYILWQADMLAFGPLPQLNATLAQIGGIALMPHEAKQEQDGTVLRPMPTAEDERFVMPETETTAEETPTEEQPEQGEEETPTEETVEPTEETVEPTEEEPEEEETEKETKTANEETEE